jgi:CRISPR/Cas system CMR subunit Cmr4 (Cas7 group RAMP superfamily)
MREYRFRLTCQTRTLLHCGAGHDSELSDADLRRRADGTLVLPGTSIAGALRSSVLAMATTCKSASQRFGRSWAFGAQAKALGRR